MKWHQDQGDQEFYHHGYGTKCSQGKWIISWVRVLTGGVDGKCTWTRSLVMIIPYSWLGYGDKTKFSTRWGLNLRGYRNACTTEY